MSESESQSQSISTEQSESRNITYKFTSEINSTCNGARKISGEVLLNDIVIGELTAYLLDRKMIHGHNLSIIADEYTEELLTITTMFLNLNGTMKKNIKSIFGNRSDCNQGGLLNIDNITIYEGYRGSKISIDFMKACLDYYLIWTLCIIQPSPLKNLDDLIFSDGVMKLSTMYARLGFVQLGKHDNELKYWGLDHNKYTGVVVPVNEIRFNNS